MILLTLLTLSQSIYLAHIRPLSTSQWILVYKENSFGRDTAKERCFHGTWVIHSLFETSRNGLATKDSFCNIYFSGLERSYATFFSKFCLHTHRLKIQQWQKITFFQVFPKRLYFILFFCKCLSKYRYRYYWGCPHTSGKSNNIGAPSQI